MLQLPTTRQFEESGADNARLTSRARPTGNAFTLSSYGLPAEILRAILRFM
jgi:hypothetical protein